MTRVRFCVGQGEPFDLHSEPGRGPTAERLGRAATTVVALNLVTGSLFSSMYLVAFVGTGYVVTGRSRQGLAVAAVLLSILYFAWGLSWNGYDYVLATVYGLAHGVIVTTLFVQIGLVAVTAFFWLADFLRVMVLTSDLSTWYTPYMIFTVLVVLIVLAHGARAALTGREGSAGRDVL